MGSYLMTFSLKYGVNILLNTNVLCLVDKTNTNRGSAWFRQVKPLPYLTSMNYLEYKYWTLNGLACFCQNFLHFHPYVLSLVVGGGNISLGCYHTYIHYIWCEYLSSFPNNPLPFMFIFCGICFLPLLRHRQFCLELFSQVGYQTVQGKCHNRRCSSHWWGI